MQIAEPEPSQC
jgi:tetratricopeptide (TPR) repeat protein